MIELVDSYLISELAQGALTDLVVKVDCPRYLLNIYGSIVAR